MKRTFYSVTQTDRLILRDELAIERTAMANERTLLAYVRTMIGMIAVGATILKFFSSWMYVIMGWSLIAVGASVLIIGFLRYLRIDSILSHIGTDSHSSKTDDFMHQWLYSVLVKLGLARVKSS
ncbi:DUF202 domain-containing protein [Candidatus Woesebacteria bacterium]|nr:DUF202 domain-containing protein [Candidatus Woesebacteria bacterium]